MPLPNPDQEFTPFDPLPASELNDLVENIEALADGSGLDALAVTPDKRGGGFFIGTIASSVFSTTGIKSVTGVGFTPKLVIFTVLPTDANGGNRMGSGAMTPSSQYATATAGTGRARSTARFMLVLVNDSSSINTSASYVSMDADGFSFNVNVNSSANFDYLAYIALA